MFKNLLVVLTFLCGILSSVDCRILTLKNGTRAEIIEPQMAEITKYRGNICKHGYVRTHVNIKYCLPYCEGGCGEGGHCAAPDKCKCSSGTHLLPNGKCAATCPTSCHNGYCNGAICTCHDGFDIDLSGKFCIPRCDNRCPANEACISKNVCACIKGYKRNVTSNVCEPDCGRGCGYGKCVGPNKCQCHQGHKLKKNFCHANCWMNCDNGRCVKDNTCECDPGYVISLPSLKCVPLCEGCEIGKCVGLDRCECPTGYKYVGKRCKPICKNDCGMNGLCVAPEKCECKKKFFLHKSTNTCVSTVKKSYRKCRSYNRIGCLPYLS